MTRKIDSLENVGIFQHIIEPRQKKNIEKINQFFRSVKDQKLENSLSFIANAEI